MRKVLSMLTVALLPSLAYAGAMDGTTTAPALGGAALVGLAIACGLGGARLLRKRRKD